MPCPFSSGSLDEFVQSRREVLKSALAVGGMSALSACLDARGMPDVPQGALDEDEIPDRQYAWNDFLPKDPHNNVIFPHHQLILGLEYVGEIVPSNQERERVDKALRSIERAYQRGNGGIAPHRPGGSSAPGILYTIGYSRKYFDRFDDPLPDDLSLPPVEHTLSEIDEPSENADDYDAAMVLTSDHAQVLLSVEQALFGRLDTLNDVPMAGTFSGIFDVVERRSGFIGPGVPRRELDMDEIHEQSPLGMGFISGFADNQATEGKVAIKEGPFANGTIQHVSRLQLALEQWYEEDKETRIDLMFSPQHSEQDVGDVGEFLASDSRLTPEIRDRTARDAQEYGQIGHTQKLAAARDEDFEPLLLRRSEALSIDDESPGFNFTSLQRDIEHFVSVRRAMNGDDFADLPESRNGILDFLTVTNRANYLIPPRSLAALPPPNPTGPATPGG